MSRHPEGAQKRWPALEFVEGDVADAASLRRALSGCSVAFYLVHGIAEGRDYRSREIAAAERFAAAAGAEGVQRVVYLGGVAPRGAPSEHLRSRLEVGEKLRAGRVPAIELRASMIIGDGSLSWLIVRDLAARLPFMVLPRWLESRTEPVALEDVIAALVGALSLPEGGSRWYDIPGPRVLSGRQILEETASVMGHARPRVVEVPLLSPRLSSHWLRLVTRADFAVARELVGGLEQDLLAVDDRYWGEIGRPRRIGFTDAARRALEAERRGGGVGGPWGTIERLLTRHAPAAG